MQYLYPYLIQIHTHPLNINIYTPNRVCYVNNKKIEPLQSRIISIHHNARSYIIKIDNIQYLDFPK